MQSSHSAYYAWCKRPAKIITAEELHLYRRMKESFADSRGSLGSRMMLKQLQLRTLSRTPSDETDCHTTPRLQSHYCAKT